MIRSWVAIVIIVCGCSSKSNERGGDPPKPDPQRPDPKPEQRSPSAEPRSIPADPKPLAHAADNHRADAQKCDPTMHSVPPNPEYQGCKSDKECAKNARCTVAQHIGNSVPANTCATDACKSDADCGKGPGGVCSCENWGNYCIPGNCRTDADCGGGGACSPSYACRGGTAGYFCHAAADECVNDQDCKRGDSWIPCRFSEQLGHWACTEMRCPVG